MSAGILVSVLIGESNVAIDPAIGGYGVADKYLGEFSPHIIIIMIMIIMMIMIVLVLICDRSNRTYFIWELSPAEGYKSHAP